MSNTHNQSNQKAIDNLNQAYEVINLSDTQIAANRRTVQMLENIKFSTWSSVGYGGCDVAGGNNATCNQVADTVAVVDNALSAAYVGKKITTPQQLNPVLTTPAESALANTGRLNNNQKGTISVDAASADYPYNPTAQSHIGPMGGQAVKTGYTDANGRDIMQRVGADGKVQSGYYVIENGKQVAVNNPNTNTGDPITNPSSQSNVKEGYHRPYMRVKTIEQITQGYIKLPNGNYLDKDGNIIQGPIDIGHTYGREHRRLEAAATEVGLTQKQFNDFVNSRPDYFRLENMNRNRGHYDEKLGIDDLDEIIRDMNQFKRAKGIK